MRCVLVQQKAFLNALEVVYEVERARCIEEGLAPRNILRELALSPNRSKLLCSTKGDTPRANIAKQDAEGVFYWTNLDRNKYGADDQFLSTCLCLNLIELVCTPPPFTCIFLSLYRVPNLMSVFCVLVTRTYRETIHAHCVIFLVLLEDLL